MPRCALGFARQRLCLHIVGRLAVASPRRETAAIGPQGHVSKSDRMLMNERGGAPEPWVFWVLWGSLGSMGSSD